MHLEQLLSSTTSESIDESLHTVMVALETNAGAVETTRGTSGSLRERWTGRKLSTEAFTREEIQYGTMYSSTSYLLHASA